MEILHIYPCTNCPYSCKFCYVNKSTKSLDINVLDSFLKDNVQKFDKIIISGGEPEHLEKIYFNDVVDTVKKYTDTVYVQTYPTSIKNYREDVEYILSYDFFERPCRMEAWDNILKFPKQFDLQMVLTPTNISLNPNAIFRKLALLKNMKSIEFMPFYDEYINVQKMKKLITYFFKVILVSKLNLPFSIVNKDKLLSGKDNDRNYYLMPDGKLTMETYDNDDTRITPEIKPEEVGLYTPNIPDVYNLYNDEVKELVCRR